MATSGEDTSSSVRGYGWALLDKVHSLRKPELHRSVPMRAPQDTTMPTPKGASWRLPGRPGGVIGRVASRRGTAGAVVALLPRPSTIRCRHEPLRSLLTESNVISSCCIAHRDIKQNLLVKRDFYLKSITMQVEDEDVEVDDQRSTTRSMLTMWATPLFGHYKYLVQFLSNLHQTLYIASNTLYQHYSSLFIV